jgi:hypothetical protein
LIPFALIEAIWGVSLIKMMFGQPTDFFEQRMGLNRVYASFNHPILYGLFVSSLFGVAWYSMKNGRLRLFLILFVGTVPALSSAPLISLFLQSSLVTWDKVMHRFKARWRILVGGFSSVVIFLSMISNSGPIKLIISYATFNPGTGWYRIAIWDYGSAEALRHPLFGIGYHDWLRPGWMVITSVDNFWLFTAMKYGFPSLIFILMAKVLIVKKFLGNEYRGDQELRKGWLISLTSLVVVGGTVYFWGSSLSMYAALMGLGAALSCQQIRNAELMTGR